MLYWAQNAFRGVDNEALNAAVALGDELGVGVVAYVALHTAIPHPTARGYSFLLDGLRDMAGALRYRGVPLVVRLERPETGIPTLASEIGAAAIVTDRSSLHLGRALRRRLAARAEIAWYEVDSEHVVPLHVIGRAHPGARSLRTVLSHALDTWLWARHDPVPRIYHEGTEGLDLTRPTPRILELLDVDHAVPPVRGLTGGTCEAGRRLGFRLTAPTGALLPWYAEHSRLSAYLRFGQIAPATVVRALRIDPSERARRMLEEVLVRRELAANFTWYTPDYATLAALPAWARTSLERHRAERPTAAYSQQELAAGQTADSLWNAAQRELVCTGRIQPYVRMYWGKRIVEWFADPADALRIALWLNDRFALDGRSANGVANIQWCFGLHDRPFPERPRLGQVRPLGLGGVRRHLDLDGYVRWASALEAPGAGASVSPPVPTVPVKSER